MAETEDAERTQALRRLKAKQGFKSHLAAYVVVNAFLVVVWAITNPGGYFWPVWSIAGWGIAVILNAWEVYRRPGITEADIQREIERNRASRT